MKVFDMSLCSINNFPEDHSTDCSMSFEFYLRGSKTKQTNKQKKLNQKAQPQRCSLGNNFHPTRSAYILVITHDTELMKRTPYVSMSTKTSKGFLSFKQADICNVFLPLSYCLREEHRYSWSKSLWFCIHEHVVVYECTTIGRKWAEVFFLRVFCPLLGAPFPFSATYICLPLCCQLKDA